MTRKERIHWIDFLKGTLLILICIGHFGYLPWWISPIVSPTSMFYVPMFFMLSGYLLTVDGRYFKDFARRKTETLLVPYIFFSVVFIVLDWNSWLHPTTDLLDNLHHCFIQGIGVNKASPLWFVMALFWGELICYPILRKVKILSGLMGVMLVLSVCAFALSEYSIRLTLQIHLLPSVATFMLSGYLLRCLHNKVRHMKVTGTLTVIAFLGG